MKYRNLTTALGLLAVLSLATSGHAQDGESSDAARLHSGRAIAYTELDPASLEHLTPPGRIRRVAAGGFAPTEIWRALEHGEKVECLDCIPAVSGLLFDTHEKTREISAWWLRRRIFGVFGPGEVYSQVVATLNDANQPEQRRAYAAEALGEFLVHAGVRHVSRAATADPSPIVRASAVRAMQRMNTAGPSGELALALADDSEEVRLAALHAATRVNVFAETEAIVARIDDESSAVRTQAIEALGALRVHDATTALIAKLAPEGEEAGSVRAAAAAALGELGSAAARSALQQAAESDEDRFVRDAARIALRRL